jgi:GNAT superfamily N-acetyltransferase
MQSSPEIEIRIAQVADATEILALQKRAFMSEAKRYNNYEIAPLRQTIDEIENDFSGYTFLVAATGDKIAGSVKARVSGGKCWVGRLIVEPALQRRGIGTMLLKAVEEMMPEVDEYFLCTGGDSDDNICFYKGAGYKENGYSVEEHGVRLIGMSKRSRSSL